MRENLKKTDIVKLLYKSLPKEFCCCNCNRKMKPNQATLFYHCVKCKSSMSFMNMEIRSQALQQCKQAIEKVYQRDKIF